MPSLLSFSMTFLVGTNFCLLLTWIAFDDETSLTRLFCVSCWSRSEFCELAPCDSSCDDRYGLGGLKGALTPEDNIRNWRHLVLYFSCVYAHCTNVDTIYWRRNKIHWRYFNRNFIQCSLMTVTAVISNPATIFFNRRQTWMPRFYSSIFEFFLKLW